MEILKIFSEFLPSFLKKHKSFVGADKMHEGLFEIFQFEFILHDLSKEWKNACKKIDVLLYWTISWWIMNYVKKLSHF